MSTVDTKALRALMEKATPVPWASSYYGDGQYVVTMPRDRSLRFHPRPPSGSDSQSATVYGAPGMARTLPGDVVVSMSGAELDGLTDAEYAAQRVADGELIVALVNAAPALLDEIRRLEAENGRLRDAAREGLYRMMHDFSEETWCASWYNGLEHQIVRMAAHDQDAQRILDAARALGGIWTWRDGDTDCVFRDMADLDEPLRAALAAQERAQQTTPPTSGAGQQPE